MPGREDYEERRQARIDRLRAASSKASEKSDAAYKQSHNLVKDIPLGQPNIIGRPALPRLRERSARLMDKALEHDSTAAYYAGRADAAENNTAISSDDPKVLDKLREKIERLESQQTRMKAINRYYRKHKTCVGCELVSDEEAQELDESMEKAYSWETAPFRSYELTSVNQRMKAAKERIRKIELIDSMPADLIEFDSGEIESDPTTNRILIRFDERQGDDVVKKLKSNGFHWSSEIGAWMRLRSRMTLRIALSICGIDPKENS